MTCPITGHEPFDITKEPDFPYRLAMLRKFIFNNFTQDCLGFYHGKGEYDKYVMLSFNEVYDLHLKERR